MFSAPRTVVLTLAPLVACATPSARPPTPPDIAAAAVSEAAVSEAEAATQEVAETQGTSEIPEIQDIPSVGDANQLPSLPQPPAIPTVSDPNCGPGLPHGLILFIGDGMGPAHEEAASWYALGAPTGLSFHAFPFRGTVTTRSANRDVTDSAAAATAMATGTRVNNGVISLQIPGDETPLQTLAQHWMACGRRVGLVTTSSLTHATPAAFGAHTASRNSYAEIGRQLFTETRPHLLLGGGGVGTDHLQAVSAGYRVVTDASALDTFVAEYQPDDALQLAGIFGDDHMPYENALNPDFPRLTEMTLAALQLLQSHPQGYFLMVEGARIDHAGHDNLRDENIVETVEFSRAVGAAIDHIGDPGRALVMVTADHETGGLSVVTPREAGQFPEVAWTTLRHTAADVNWYAWGLGADAIAQALDMPDVYWVFRGAVPR